MIGAMIKLMVVVAVMPVHHQNIYGPRMSQRIFEFADLIYYQTEDCQSRGREETGYGR